MKRFKILIKSSLKESFIMGAGIMPFGFLQKMNRNPHPIIINYHLASDLEVPHYKHISKFNTVGKFEKDLDFILKHFQVINLNQLIQSIRGEISLPKNALLLTFDDGYREISEIVAPLLLKKGIPATFFINSAFIDNYTMFYRNKASVLIDYIQKNQSAIRKELNSLCAMLKIQPERIYTYLLSIKYKNRDVLDTLSNELNFDFKLYLDTVKPYLSTDQINRLIADGFTIGSHSIDHPNFLQIDVNEQIRQVKDSIGFITQKFNLNYKAFAFPHRGDGIPEEFFRRISTEYPIDVFFGTYDSCSEKQSNFRERTGIMEIHNVSVKTGTKYYYLKTMLK